MDSKIYNRNLINVNDNVYSIEQIHFYNDDGIILSTDKKERTFTFRNETKLRRKLNLNRKENFIIKYEYKGIYKNPYDLYIYSDNVDMEYLGKNISKSCYFGTDDVYLCQSYHSYRINGVIVKTKYKTLSSKKSRLVAKVEYLIKKELLYIGDYRTLPEKELSDLLNRIFRLNKRIQKENDRLLLREKLQK